MEGRRRDMTACLDLSSPLHKHDACLMASCLQGLGPVPCREALSNCFLGDANLLRDGAVAGP